MTSFAIFFSGCLVVLLAGCGAGPLPRMASLIGQEAFQSPDFPAQNREWIRLSKIGLVVHSDGTAPDAAPAISDRYVEVLTLRTEKFLTQHCPFQEILTVPPPSFVNFSRARESQFQHSPVSHQILVVLSGIERVGPEKIGEATVMTQMSGIVIEHSALAEVGVYRLSDKKMIFTVSGWGTESLEQLDAPIGNHQPSPGEARAILRARSGQEALDRALDQLAEACQSTKS